MRKIPLIVSLLVGFLSTPFAYLLALAFERGADAAYSIWLIGMYPILIIIVFFLGYRWPINAGQYGFIAVISSYVGALVVIPGAGNLLPLEIIMELLYSIPASFSGWLGAYLSRKNKGVKAIKPKEIDIYNKGVNNNSDQ